MSINKPKVMVGLFAAGVRTLLFHWSAVAIHCPDFLLALRETQSDREAESTTFVGEEAEFGSG